METIHVTLLGKEALPVYYPIQEMDFKEIYLIHTKENKDIAKRIKRVATEENRKCKLCEVSAFDFLQAQQVYSDIHAKHPDAKFVYNITGGTKLMAIAAYGIAIKYNAEIGYTDAKSYISINTGEKKPLDCKLSFETIFKLQGQIEKRHTEYVDNEDAISVAQQIMGFKEKNSRFFSVLIKLHRTGELPSSYNTDTYSYQKSKNNIVVRKNGKVLLNVTHNDINKLMFEGRWWEILVAHTIYESTGGKYAIWTDVEFSPKDEKSQQSDNSKNEIDVLLNIGTTLLFVECKSGKFDQNTIYKMGFVRGSYGSDKSNSVLVSFYPLDPNIPTNKDLCEKSTQWSAGYYISSWWKKCTRECQTTY